MFKLAIGEYELWREESTHGSYVIICRPLQERVCQRLLPDEGSAGETYWWENAIVIGGTWSCCRDTSRHDEVFVVSEWDLCQELCEESSGCVVWMMRMKNLGGTGERRGIIYPKATQDRRNSRSRLLGRQQHTESPRYDVWERGLTDRAAWIFGSNMQKSTDARFWEEDSAMEVSLGFGGSEVVLRIPWSASACSVMQYSWRENYRLKDLWCLRSGFGKCCESTLRSPSSTNTFYTI
jgi:hypothetical protein